jgi:hypothetical protein
VQISAFDPGQASTPWRVAPVNERPAAIRPKIAARWSSNRRSGVELSVSLPV